jgi:hypothetical protein
MIIAVNKGTTRRFLPKEECHRHEGSPARVNLREFYQLRFARIAPLLLILLAILSGLHLAQVKGFVVSPKAGGLGRALLAALTFHINLLEARRGYLPASCGHVPSIPTLYGGNTPILAEWMLLPWVASLLFLLQGIVSLPLFSGLLAP